MLRIAVSLILLIVIPGLALAQSFEVGDIRIEGNRRVEGSSIESVLSTKVGKTATAGDIDADIRSIYRLGRFADVSAEVEENVLIYRVAERPLVRQVEFSGNEEFSDESLKAASSVKTPGIFDPEEVEKSIEAIRALYLEEGFYSTEVASGVEVDEENEATVTFEIAEGEKVLVEKIVFEGNSVFSAKELKGFIQTREKWFLSWMTGRGAYNEEMLQTDLEIIADQYFNVGYVRVKVKQPVVTLSENKKGLDVLIEIEEGGEFRIGKLDVQGDLIVEKEELLALGKLRSGDVFNRAQLRADIFALNDLYSDRGYAYVNVAPLTGVDADKGTIDVSFDIEQGIEVTIDRIRIKGNTKTRDKVIRRELRLVEGDLYSSGKIKESRRRVNNLGFFEEVNVATSKGADESRVDLDVEVSERPTGTFSLGFGYSSVDKFIGQGSVSQDNFLGLALKLNLSGSLGGSSNTYQVGILDPYFLDTKISAGFDVYKSEREWNDFTEKSTGGDIKVGFPVGADSRAFFVYRYEEKEIFDVTPGSIFEQDAGVSTLSSIKGSVGRNTTDYRPDPSRGSISEGSIEFAGLGGTEKFAKYIVDHRRFFPFKWGTVFSVHGRLGHIMEVGGETIPVDERFFLGGINTIRGFKTREVGPRNSAGEYTGGNTEAYFNFEYVFPVNKEMGLKGVVFFDTGNAWSQGSDAFTDMRYSAGAGIRWNSPMGPLRLEWGYNLDPEEFEEDSEFEFSIGKAF